MQAHSWYIQKLTLPLLGCFLILLRHINGLHFLPLTEGVIFFFTLFNPTALPLVMVVFLGLFADLIASAFFGLNTFIFVLIFFVVNFFRRFLSDLSFWGIWIFFIILNVLILLFSALIFFLFLGHGYPVTLYLQEGVSLCLFYPALMRLCNRLNTWLTGGDYDRLEV